MVQNIKGGLSGIVFFCVSIFSYFNYASIYLYIIQIFKKIKVIWGLRKSLNTPLSFFHKRYTGKMSYLCVYVWKYAGRASTTSSP